MKQKNFYVSVMGTIGSGKTTVARLLVKKLKFQLLEENFGENAFLPRFYQDMRRWAFHSQTFFLIEKISQIRQTKELLKTGSVIQDTPIQQDVYSYAKAQHVLGNMDDDEWRLYEKMYHSFEPMLPIPDVIIYLDASIPILQNRIVLRGRNYEKKISIRYIKLLDTLNRKWVSEQKSIAIISISTDNLNVVDNGKDQENIIEQIISFSPSFGLNRNK